MKFPDPNKHTILTLDVGDAHTGFAVFSCGERISSGVIECVQPISSLKVFTALNSIVGKAKDIGVVDVVVIEDYAWGANLRVRQAELVGSVKLMLCINKLFSCCITNISIKTAKKAASGNGNATKSEVRKSLAEYRPLCSHDADAIALYLAYCDVWKKPSDKMVRGTIWKQMLNKM